MLSEIFQDLSQTYKTRQNAVRKAEKVINKVNMELPRRSLIIGVTEEGRYFPIVRLRGESTMYLSYLASNGVCVIG